MSHAAASARKGHRRRNEDFSFPFLILLRLLVAKLSCGSRGEI
jgi:hypothetical protein